ncbi:hypothetical protein NDU88_005473 [Pleurodeles waltl]|uniref:Uncharacterized protein n=1 Tax=Pleurodeles waltl TaxID=8319 RepID=A0AAV7TVL8_PLEWA|nr:hypothetical protein NDU88_005473 [Pleurodeles waltl]
MATTRGIEWEALKVVIRGESLCKTYGIRKRLDQELTQQEYILSALQRQVDNGAVSESDYLEVRNSGIDWIIMSAGIIGSGCFGKGTARAYVGLAPPAGASHSHHPDALRSFWRKDFRTVTGQNIYATPWSVGVARIREYLDDLRMPRLMEAQTEELEGEVSLDDLVEALGGMESGKAPGPDGLPVEFY